MEILNLKQGSEEWLSERQRHFTASEASAMLGYSKYMSRKDLIALKAFGIQKDQKGSEYIFRKGHETEDQQRKIIEEELSESLFPVVAKSMIDGLPLLASFDGITMDGEIIFEHKLWNENLSEYILSEDDLPDSHWPQVEQQLMISKAGHCIFVISDGTKEKRTLLNYYSQQERKQKIIDGWKIFQGDMQEAITKKDPYQQQIKTEAKVIDSFPDLKIKIEGKVLSTNLDHFKQKAMIQINEINKELTKDEHFNQADSDVKFLKGAIKNIDEVKSKAIDSTSDVKAVFDALDEIREKMNRIKLDLQKDIKTKKDELKKAIKFKTANKIFSYEDELSHQISGFLLPKSNVTDLLDNAIKNKKTLKSVEEACDNVFTDERLRLNDAAKNAMKNLSALDEIAGSEKSFLFPDFQNYINCDLLSVKNMIESRIENHIAEVELQKRIKEEAEEKQKNDYKAESNDHIDISTDYNSVDLIDTQGMINQKNPFVCKASVSVHSNIFGRFSLSDTFSEFNLASGLYEITINKIEE
jgi:predicted phage-related endonuclease